MSSAVQDARQNTTPAPAIAPRELAALGELLDALEARQIRLSVTPDGRLVSDAPRGAMTQDLRARIAAHKGAILRALRMAGTLAPMCGADPAAHGEPDYSPTLARWVCPACEPAVFAVFCAAPTRAYLARRRAAQDARAAVQLDADPAASAGPRAPSTRSPAPAATQNRAALARDLLAAGAARQYPPLAYAWAQGPSLGPARPYKSVASGAEGWRTFAAGAPLADLLAACQAAGLDGSGADPGAQDSAQAAASSAEQLAPCDWPETFAALDAGALWLARLDGSAAGAMERRELDALARPDAGGAEGGATARRLVELMERERITQLWVHPTWAQAAGLPMRPMSERGMHEGAAHPFAAGPWALPAPGSASSSAAEGAGVEAVEAVEAVGSVARGAGVAGVLFDAGERWGMRKPGTLRPWMRFYRRGQSGTIALYLTQLDARIAWRTARDAAELLAAALAYRDALRGFAYRDGPGASGTALMRVLHRGSAALDLTASTTPADFPAPAREPGLTAHAGWLRMWTPEERDTGRYVQAYDKNGMYLSACSSLRVGLGTPDHLTSEAGGEGAAQLAEALDALTTQRRPRPPRPVGYWLARVTFDAAPDWLSAGVLPHPCAMELGAPDPAAAWAWYHSATLELAAEAGARVEAREAYVWRELHEPLEPWYQRLRDARTHLAEHIAADQAAGRDGGAARLALAAVKATYTQGLGWLDASWLREGEEPADLYRPDWRHAAIATANANLWRNLAKVYRVTGRAPFAVMEDTAYYASPVADPLDADHAPALRLGAGLGQYKVKLAGRAAAALAPVWEAIEAGMRPGITLRAFHHAIEAAGGAVDGQHEPESEGQEHD